MKKLLLIFSFVNTTIIFSQNYNDLKIKEEYDIYNTNLVNVTYELCTNNPNADQLDFVDGMSHILE